MEELYLANVEGQPPALPRCRCSVPISESGSATGFKGDVLERQLAYWKEKLAGLSATPLDLPSDRPRPTVETMKGTSEYVRFPRSDQRIVQTLARREGVTQFMVLLAVFQVLLHRYTNQDDLPVGSVIANRNRVELDNVVGFFDNPIVLRVDASGNPTFREFLRRVRDVALGAYTNQYLPFDLIVKELQPERTSNRTPFIQAMFVFLLNYPAMETGDCGPQSQFRTTCKAGKPCSICFSVCVPRTADLKANWLTTATSSMRPRSPAWAATSDDCWKR